MPLFTFPTQRRDLDCSSMPDEVQDNAWEPFTFNGVARFAYASAGRLWLVSVITAAICGGVVTWFLAERWSPQIEAAIAKLPEQGSIRDGSLRWPSREPVELAQSSFLAISVQPGAAPELAGPADVELSFRARELHLRSFFGYAVLPYPGGWIISLNRAEMQPWWGAWKPAFLGLAGAAVALGLLIAWPLIGLLYCPVVKLLAFYADRQTSWRGAWQSSRASLLAPGLFMAFAVVLYAFQEMTLLGLLALFVGHFALQLVYVLGSTMSLRPLPDVIKGNPFAPPQPGDPAAEPAPSQDEPPKAGPQPEPGESSE